MEDASIDYEDDFDVDDDDDDDDHATAIDYVPDLRDKRRWAFSGGIPAVGIPHDGTTQRE